MFKPVHIDVMYNGVVLEGARIVGIRQQPVYDVSGQQLLGEERTVSIAWGEHDPNSQNGRELP